MWLFYKRSGHDDQLDKETRTLHNSLYFLNMNKGVSSRGVNKGASYLCDPVFITCGKKWLSYLSASNMLVCFNAYCSFYFHCDTHLPSCIYKTPYSAVSLHPVLIVVVCVYLPVDLFSA